MGPTKDLWPQCGSSFVTSLIYFLLFVFIASLVCLSVSVCKNTCIKRGVRIHPGAPKTQISRCLIRLKKCKFLLVSRRLYLSDVVKLVRVMADQAKIEAVLDLLNLNKAQLVTVTAGVVPSRIFSEHKEQGLKVKG